MSLKLKLSLIAIFISTFCQAQFEAKLIPKKGLFVNQGALQWAMGSEINFLNADRKQHEYYFTWWEQDADTTNPQQDILFIGSANTAVQGTFSLYRTNRKIRTSLQCVWNKKSAGVCDLLYTRLWYPFFKNANWTDKEGKPLQHLEKEFTDTVLIANTPFGTYRFSSSHPFSIQLDTLLHPSAFGFNTRSQFIRFLGKSVTLTEKDTLSRTFSIEQIEAPLITGNKTFCVNEPVINFASNTWTPPSGKQLLLPTPREWTTLPGFTSISTKANKVNDSALLLFNKVAKRYWKVDGYLYPKWSLKKDTQLSEEAYAIFIQDSILINYSSSVGLQYAIETLGQLLEQKEQQLILRNGLIKDVPQNSWRGIHMFTGPQSLPLHLKMYQSVLQPLKINKVVLQCEQATWNSFPAIHNPISIHREDLKKEFEYLKTNHIEPIPLIQSLGHMEWFFKPTQHRHLATNPSYPYTLNVNQPEGKRVMLSLWKEAIELLEPKTIHVGFDEIGMIGFHWPKEKEVQLFRQQLARLNRFSKKRKLALMIWGDMGLAPGEAPDACNGIDQERAAKIRSSIPKNTWIADWHYLGNPNPEAYRSNLKLWKREGFRPIASPWFVPDNIRGFALAANEEKAGVLQTTWADFESSEVNMLKNIEQFGAYVLALDYAWNGRRELPAALPYHGVIEWTKRFYRQALPLSSRHGLNWKGIVQLENVTNPTATELPNQIVFSLENSPKIEGIKLNYQTAQLLPEATPVALLTGWKADSTIFTIPLLYGRDVRAEQDQRPIFISVLEKGEKDWYHFFSTPTGIDRIEIQQIHPGAGLRITELSLIQ